MKIIGFYRFFRSRLFFERVRQLERERIEKTPKWTLQGVQNGPKVVKNRAFGFQVELLDQLWTAKLPSWNALGHQNNVLQRFKPPS